MKYDRNSNEYRLAEKIVHLENALKLANRMLNNNGKLGVLPNVNTSFTESSKFHSKVRKIICSCG